MHREACTILKGGVSNGLFIPNHLNSHSSCLNPLQQITTDSSTWRTTPPSHEPNPISTWEIHLGNQLRNQLGSASAPTPLNTLIPSAAPRSPQLPLTIPTSSPSTLSILHKKWEEFCNASSGIGLTALVLTIVFGVGAWVGMDMQYNQGAKSLELTIWATCADHEGPSKSFEKKLCLISFPQIQSTSLCEGVVGKDFNRLQPHDVSFAIAVQPRSILSNDLEPESRMQSLIYNLGGFEREMILQYPSNTPPTPKSGPPSSPSSKTSSSSPSS